MANEKYKAIAKIRINYLFNLLLQSDEFDKTAIKAIEKIRLKYNIRLSKDQKMVYCRFCKSKYINPKIRFKKIKKNHLSNMQKIITCDFCGKDRRFSI